MDKTIHHVNHEDKAKSVDWEAFRRFCKAQRGRLAHRFAQAEKRVNQARVDAMEDWDGHRPASGKKPGLDYYDGRWK